MSKSKQTTLFQSWGTNTVPKKKHYNTNSYNCKGAINLCDDEDDEDDEALRLALQESLKEVDKPFGASCTGIDGDTNSGDAFSEDSNDIYKDIALSELNVQNIPDSANIEHLPGFDNNAGRIWIYPTNYPVRDYQYNIVKNALFNNTMVVLPTGLGKTFIAAVAMYNFYRWYPQGKIIFMAPTKPLVAQQIEACYNIMGIPQDDTAEMTGAMNPTDRKRAWMIKRVFFLTPQVLTNDLSRTACPAESVKCLVVDEAHKATGNHAYCQVVRELIKYNEDFRVLALSATPGSDIKAVQQVINNLLVSHIELRSEDSEDIRQYSHERKVDKVVVPLGQELAGVKEKYLQVMTVIVMRLRRMGVLYKREPRSLSKFMILKAREAFRQDPPPNLPRNQFGAVEGDFALCMSLYHGYDLLQQHGLRSLFNYLESIITGEKGYGRTKTELMKNADFRDLMENLRGKFEPIKAPDPSVRPSQMSPVRASQLAKPIEIGHPKMEKLRDIVVEHFEKYRNDGLETRIMIFSQFRDSVNEITEILNRHRPLVKVMSFIGQSSAGKSTKGFSQKEQLKVMKQFRDGGYNTLVSTCVGEEGLDIGDVDLIICFDAHKSPIRLVQRMGRTGRKREGRIVMLVTEGKEEQIYNQSQYSKRSIHKAIQNGTKSLHFYPKNSTMIPKGLTPTCHKMHITVHNKYDAQAAKGKPSKVQKNHLTDTYAGTSKASTRSKQRASDKKDGFLTAEELQYWNDHFKVDEKIPIIKSPTINSLSGKQVNETSTGGQDLVLNLGEWMPWQNQLQDYKMVDHSLQSKHLVQLVEFIDLQNSISGEDDNYGLEMQMYLNQEDIIKPGQSHKSNKGILKYCTTSVDANNVKEKAEQVQRKRRSELLPEFHVEEENDSDIELPGLDDIIKEKGENIPKKDKKKKNKHVPDHGRDETTSALIEIIEDKDSEDFVKGDNDLENHTDHVEHLPELPNLGEDEIDKNNSQSKMQRKKSEDYVIEQEAINLNTDNQIIDAGSDVQTAMDIDSDLECRQEINHEVIENDVHERMKTEKQKLSNLLPIFEDLNSMVKSENLNNIEEEENPGSCAVKTPPRIEEVSQLIKELDEKIMPLSPVDILDLVDEWEKDKVTCARSPSGNINFLTEQTSNVASQTLPGCVKAKMSVSSNSIQIKPSCVKERQKNITKLFDIQQSTSSVINNGSVNKSMYVTNNSERIGENISEVFEKFSENDKASITMNLSNLSENNFESSISQETHVSIPFKNYESKESDSNKTEKLRQSSDSTESNLSEHFDQSKKEIEPQNTCERICISSVKNCSTPLTHKVSITGDEIKEDSFFSESNPFFEQIQTPDLPESINTPKQLVEENLKSNISDKRALSKSLNTTQITFTQALAFVHESFNATGNQSLTEYISSGNKETFVSSLPHDSIRLQRYTNFKDKRLSSSSNSILDDTNESKSNVSVQEGNKCHENSCDNDTSRPNKNPITEECEEDFGPDFDLGFDFADEFDEIVPPSPPESTQPFSQVSKSAVAANTFLSDCNATASSSQSLIGGLGEKFTQKGAEMSTLVDKANNCDNLVNYKELEHEEGGKVETIQLDSTIEVPPAVVHKQDCNNISDHDESTSPSLLTQDLKYSNRVPNSSVQYLTNRKIHTGMFQHKFGASCSTPTQVARILPHIVHNKLVTGFDVRTESVKMNITESDFHEESKHATFNKEPNKYNASNTFDVQSKDNCLPKNSKPIKTLQESSNISPIKELQLSNEDIKEFVATNESGDNGICCALDLSDTDLDESLIQIKMKKKPKIILISPETPSEANQRADRNLDISDFNTPLKQPQRKSSKRKVISSDSEAVNTPVSCYKKQRIDRKVNFTDMNFTDDDDDDFEAASYFDKKSTKQKEDQPSKLNRKDFKHKRKKKICGFIEEEADVSEDGSDVSSGNEEEEYGDYYDASFVNDATQLTQGVTDSSHHDTDMRAVYLQSVKSPMSSGNMVPSKFRLQYSYDCHMDVFSQQPRGEDEEESCYMEDSFCIDTDNELGDSEFVDEPTIMEARIIKGRGKRHTRNSNKNIIENQINKKKNMKGTKRRRIQRIEESSEDELERNETGNLDISKEKTEVLFTNRTKEDEDYNSAIKMSLLDQKPQSLVDPEEEEDFKKAIELSLKENKKSEQRKSLNNRQDKTLVAIKQRSSMLQESGFMFKANESNTSGSSPVLTGSTEISSLGSRSKLGLNNIKNCHAPDKTEKKSFCESIQNVNIKRKEQTCSSTACVNQTSSIQTAISKRVNSSINKSAIDVCSKSLVHLPKQFCDELVGDNADFDLSFDLGLDDLVEAPTDDIGQDSFAGQRMKDEVNDKYKKSDVTEPKKKHGKIDKQVYNCKNISGTDVSDSLFNNTIDELNTKWADYNKQEKHSRTTTAQISPNINITKKYSSKSNDTVAPGSKISPVQSISKDERLRISKLKQEEFKRKHAEKLKQNTGVVSEQITILDHTLPNDTTATFSHGAYASPMPDNTLTTSILHPINPKGQIVTVFVDSREINGAQEVISNLRAKHGFTTLVTQLSGCDYILSNRMAVERKFLSDFTNGSNKNKLVDRIKHMSQLFERSILLVEKDRVKLGEKDPQRPLLKSKYVETMLASLCQMQVKIYFSESQENTAEVIAQLIDTEKRKGYTVDWSVNLNEAQQQLLKFYLSLPKVSFVTALNFTCSYRSLRDFIKSPVGVIEKKGHISRNKAKEIHNYLQHKFNLQMIGIKKG